MTLGEVLTSRREALGLSLGDIERWSNLPFYRDLESDDRVALEHASLGALRTIAGSLHLELFELLELQCDFCGRASVSNELYTRASRNEIVRRAREAKGLSASALGDRLALVDWALGALEADHSFLEICDFGFMERLAGTLDVPLQVLLQLRCPRCRQ